MPDTQLPDPQAAVNAVLSDTPTAPSPAPVLPSEATAETASTPLPEPETVPTELVQPAAEVTIPVIPEPITPEPAPMAPPVEMNNVTMGDDTPLAFATVPVAAATVATPVMSAPSMSGGGSVPPLPPVPPAPIPPVPEAPKKKGGKKKLVTVLASIMLMLVGLTGLIAYGYYSGNPAIIAGVDGGMDTLTGGSEGRNYGTIDSGRRRDDPNWTPPTQGGVPVDQGPTKDELHAQCDAHGASWDDARSACAYPPGTGPLNPPIMTLDQCAALRGSASNPNGNWDGGDKNATTDTKGLCTTGAGGIRTCALDNNTSGACKVEKVSCRRGGQNGVACNEEIVSTSGSESTDDIKCGSQQIDVVCNGCGSQPVAFANRLTGVDCKPEQRITENPPPSNPSPSPSPSVAPTFMCDNISRTPTSTPKIGDKFTFTCKGTSVPAGALSLTYDFRYAINSGAWSNMTNKTATTTELTVAACGSYTVQCRTCATISGSKQCDPNWTGATQ